MVVAVQVQGMAHQPGIDGPDQERLTDPAHRDNHRVFVGKAGVGAFGDENWIRVDGTAKIVYLNGSDVRR
jgi:hypothetical protein